MADHSIWLLVLWRGEILSCRAFGPAPVTLSNKERTSYHPAIDFPCGLVNDCLFSLNHTTRLALVIYANDLGPELEGLTGGSGWERLEEGDESLAVYDSARVEFWHAWNGSTCTLTGIEVNNFLGGAFEG
jgi:hypothetical protein